MIPVEQKIFFQSWELLKEFYYIKQTDKEEVWEDLIEKSNRIFNSGTDPATKTLASKLSLTVIRYLEERSKMN